MKHVVEWAVGCFLIILIAGGAILATITAMLQTPVGFVALIAASFLVVGLAALFAVVIMIWLWNWARRTAMAQSRADEFVQPDENGRFPVPVAALRSDAGIAAAFDLNKASFFSNMHTYNNAPVGAPMSAADTQPAPAINAPGSFLQLYQSGQLPQDKILMGFGTESGEPVYATWGELFSALVGGTSGSGKSTIVRLMLAQSAMQGGKFIVIDPHYKSGEESLGASLEPLRFTMPFDVASEEMEMVDALRYVSDIGKRRLSGIDKERSPIVLVIDETPGILEGGYGEEVSRQLRETLSTVVRETRKVGIYAFAIGQGFQAEIMPSKIRNSFASMVGCSMRKDEARYMSGNGRFASAVDTIRGYQAAWMNTRREIVMLNVPNCTQSDLELVARHIEKTSKTDTASHEITLPPVEAPSGAPPIAPSGAPSDTLSGTYLQRHFPKAGRGGRTASEVVAEGEEDKQATHIIRLFMAGDSLTKIIREVYKVTSGDRYTAASAEVNDIIRAHIAKLGGHN